MGQNSLCNARSVIEIRSDSRWYWPDWKEMWTQRDLLLMLTWRDIQVKYKQTLLGLAWAVLVPATTMLIFGTIFGKVAGLPSEGVNPYLFYLAGLVPWQYFANSLNMGSNSLVSYAHLLTKAYMPRMFIPLGVCLANLVDFAIAFAFLLILMIAMGITITPAILLVPLLMLIVFLCAYGASLFFSAMNVKYRDIKFVIPFLVQMWMYCSVIVPFSRIPESWGWARQLYALNPMAGVIEGMRWILLHHQTDIETAMPWPLLLRALLTSLLFLIAGIIYFRRTERVFADIV